VLAIGLISAVSVLSLAQAIDAQHPVEQAAVCAVATHRLFVAAPAQDQAALSTLNNAWSAELSRRAMALSLSNDDVVQAIERAQNAYENALEAEIIAVNDNCITSAPE